MTAMRVAIGEHAVNGCLLGPQELECDLLVLKTLVYFEEVWLDLSGRIGPGREQQLFNLRFVGLRC